MNKTDQNIAAYMFNAFDNEMSQFTQNEWAKMTDVQERDKKSREIKSKYGYVNGWIIVNGKGFSRELAFPGKIFPRWPSDQGLSD